jgi:hypothetical protein
MDCSETVNDPVQPNMNQTVGFFLCKKTGTGGAYSVCMGDADCGAGLWCGFIDMAQTIAECLPICSDTVQCVMPPSDAGVNMIACVPLTSQPSNAGYCLPQ